VPGGGVRRRVGGAEGDPPRAVRRSEVPNPLQRRSRRRPRPRSGRRRTRTRSTVGRPGDRSPTRPPCTRHGPCEVAGRPEAAAVAHGRIDPEQQGRCHRVSGWDELLRRQLAAIHVAEGVRAVGREEDAPAAVGREAGPVGRDLVEHAGDRSAPPVVGPIVTPPLLTECGQDTRIEAVACSSPTSQSRNRTRPRDHTCWHRVGCPRGRADSDAGPPFHPTVGDGPDQGPVVKLVLVGVGAGEAGDGLIEAVAATQIRGHGDAVA